MFSSFETNNKKHKQILKKVGKKVMKIFFCFAIKMFTLKWSEAEK